MAFPYETAHLISHLRASYLVLADSDEYTLRIIKSTEINGSNTTISSGPELLESPPITFHIARHVQKSLHNVEGSNGHKNGRRKNQRWRFLNARQDKEKERKRRNIGKYVGHVPEEVVEGTFGITVGFGSKQNASRAHTQLPLLETELQTGEYGFDDSRGESLEYEEDVDTTQVLTNEANDSSGSTFELAYSKTITGSKTSKKSTPGIARFFLSKAKGKEEDSDSESDSDGSIKTLVFKPIPEKSLGLIEEEMNNEDITDDGDITETEEKRRSRRLSKKSTALDNSDLITIDSDFGVPVDSKGQVVRNWNGKDAKDETSPNSKRNVRQEEYEEEEDEDDEDDEDFEDGSEYEYDDLDVSSTDSAFTDIETDSILVSSILLNSFEDSNSNSYLFDNPTAANSFRLGKKSRRRKRRGSSFDHQSLSKTTGVSVNLKTVSSQTSMFHPKGQSPGPSKSIASFKKPAPSLTFEKLDVDNSKGISSNLSSLIRSRFKSININPLVYYSFVSSPVLSDIATKVLLNIFLPPNSQPTIKDLEVNPSLVIVDCIGYILLSLSKLPEFEISITDTSFLNPNNWRLELVDGDGDPFGLFGILERTRELASYKNLKEVALCKVNGEEEIQKNETQTPLPMEVKANLAAYLKRGSRASLGNLKGFGSPGDQIHSDVNDENVELRILNYPPNAIHSPGGLPFYVSTKWTILQALKEFCSQYNLPLKYKFREVYTAVSNITLRTLSNDTINQARPISLQDKVTDLQGNVLVLVPSADLINCQSELNNLFSNITPSESTFSNITPDKKHLEERFEVLSLEKNSKSPLKLHAAPTSTPLRALVKDSSKTRNQPSVESENNSNKYFDEIMTGKNPSLPTNLNTIYFKWKVHRKKATLIKQIERYLILDGDYIHLTPTDEIFFKKTLGDNPFTNQSEGNSNNHLHQFHHYNYNAYLKKLILKTTSFHITQIVKLKQYKDSKNPNHFKIVIEKVQDPSKEAVKKKYDLEAFNSKDCQEIMERLKWVSQVYSVLQPQTKGISDMQLHPS